MVKDMYTKEEAKKLGIILCAVLVIIFIILINYVINSLFDVTRNGPDITTTKLTTTLPVDYGFEELTENEKIELNEEFNSAPFITALNNATHGNLKLIRVNLIESEASKFRFIYSYINPTGGHTLSLEEINQHTMKIFGTRLDTHNIENYLLDDEKYGFNITQQANFCLKVMKKQPEALFVAISSREGEICNDDILNRMIINYKKEEANYVYKSFIVVD